MYKSRIKKTAGSLTVAVDSQNGELLSLVDESSGDNLIKNSSYTLPNPFALTIGGITLTAPSNTDIKKTPALQHEVREGASSITVVYPMLTDGVRFFDITVTVEIRCLKDRRLTGKTAERRRPHAHGAGPSSGRKNGKAAAGGALNRQRPASRAAGTGENDSPRLRP